MHFSSYSWRAALVHVFPIVSGRWVVQQDRTLCLRLESCGFKFCVQQSFTVGCLSNAHYPHLLQGIGDLAFSIVRHFGQEVY